MLEIERKFLIDKLPDLSNVSCVQITQGYLSFVPEIRIRKKGNQYFLTSKGEGTLKRKEVEFEIDEFTYRNLSCLLRGAIIQKSRFEIPSDNGLVIELDMYDGKLEGLITAEIEFLNEEQASAFKIPNWFGEEITEDKRYKNKNLAQLETADIGNLLKRGNSIQKKR